MGSRLQFKKLFEPVRIGEMEVRNRIVLSPMETNLGSNDGYVTERLKDYYEERAKGGAGLVIVGFACVDSPVGRRLSHQLFVDDDRFIPGLTELAKVIKRHDARAALQLVHAGRTGTQPVAPSAIAKPGEKPPRELTVTEIKDLVAHHARAAERAKKAGFDAVEIHAAHSYLIANFLSPVWNKRKDAYGGDLEGRAKLLLEIVKSVRESVGPTFPFWCRINGAEIGMEGGSTIKDGQALARMLEEAGVNAINVSATSMEPIWINFWVVEGESLPPTAHPPGFLIYLAEAMKRVVNVPVIAIGRITPEVGEKSLREQKVDLVAIGKALFADAELPNKVASERLEDIRPCICCLNCIERVVFMDTAVGCSVNAALGKEREYAIRPADKKKRVMVAGGGPAGMEAARVAALRGHQVWLYEKGNSLGGQLRLAATPPYKSVIGRFSDYLQTQIRKLGVKVNLGKELTLSLVKEMKPDVVIVATGMISITAHIAGIDRENVVTAEDVLTGKAETGNRIIVIGGGVTGCETAEFLAKKGNKVTIVEMLDNLAVNMGTQARRLLLDKLAAQEVTVLTGVKCEEATDRGLVVVDGGERRQSLETDTIVLAVGGRSNRGLFEALKGEVPEIYLAGDCVEPGHIIEAVADGSKLGRII
jgi:2,4-dienoyl-CoA reductase-like NADH-dependent reductase (Old Yellow Enzyme family)/thioredoxin reductase